MLLWTGVRIIIHAIYLVTFMPELRLHTDGCPGNHVLRAALVLYEDTGFDFCYESYSVASGVCWFWCVCRFAKICNNVKHVRTFRSAEAAKVARVQRRHVRSSSGTVSSSPLTRWASLRVEVWRLGVEAVRRINKYIK